MYVICPGPIAYLSTALCFIMHIIHMIWFIMHNPQNTVHNNVLKLALGCIPCCAVSIIKYFCYLSFVISQSTKPYAAPNIMIWYLMLV